MKFFKKKDLIVIIILLVVALVGLFIITQFNSTGEKKALVYFDNQQILEVDLTKGVDKSIEIPGHEHVILHQYADGTIAFESSDCPDKVCVNTGKLKYSGSSAACLPNKIVVKIIDKGNEQDFDIIVR